MYIKLLVCSYNCTKNDTAKKSPCFLIFGKQPLLPIDLYCRIKPKGQIKVTHQEYAKDLNAGFIMHMIWPP